MLTPVRSLIVISIFACSGGCEITHDMWEQASRHTVDYPHVVGTLAPDRQDRPDALVVCYTVMGAGWSGERPFYTVIRLNPDGSVPEPFALHQTAHDLSLALEELGPDHEHQIKGVVLGDQDWDAGKRALHSRQFRKLDDPHGGVSTIESFSMERSGLTPVAYWPGGTSSRRDSIRGRCRRTARS